MTTARATSAATRRIYARLQSFARLLAVDIGGAVGLILLIGARPGQVVAKMLSDAAAPIALGTIIGIAGALAATRVIESFLFQTEPTDPATLVAVAVILAASGCLAAWIPAQHAARVDPVTALRAE